MAKMNGNWWKPAALAAAVIAGVAWARSQTGVQKAGGGELKVGDRVSISAGRLLWGEKGPVPLPIVVPDALLVVQINNADPSGLRGDVVGYVDPLDKKPISYPGPAGIGPVGFERAHVIDVFPATPKAA